MKTWMAMIAVVCGLALGCATTRPVVKVQVEATHLTDTPDMRCTINVEL